MQMLISSIALLAIVACDNATPASSPSAGIPQMPDPDSVRLYDCQYGDSAVHAAVVGDSVTIEIVDFAVEPFADRLGIQPIDYRMPERLILSSPVGSASVARSSTDPILTEFYNQEAETGMGFFHEASPGDVRNWSMTGKGLQFDLSRVERAFARQSGDYTESVYRVFLQVHADQDTRTANLALEFPLNACAVNR